MMFFYLISIIIIIIPLFQILSYSKTENNNKKIKVTKVYYIYALLVFGFMFFSEMFTLSENHYFLTQMILTLFIGFGILLLLFGKKVKQK